jgi:hypothetical protein
VLPLLDSHSKVIPAGDAAAWRGLVRFVSDRMSPPTAARYARLVGGQPAIASGPRPIEVGSTIPGFEVTALELGREVVLTGRHRFSRYQIVFKVSQGTTSAESAVSVESRAEFLGRLGRLYRVLVVGTRFHVLAVRRMLRSIAREAAAPESEIPDGA